MPAKLPPMPAGKACAAPTRARPHGYTGEPHGRRRHREAGEPYCAECELKPRQSSTTRAPAAAGMACAAASPRYPQGFTGTRTGRRRHREAGEDYCAECKVLSPALKPPSDICAKPHKRGPKKGISRTGYNAGYIAHKDAGEHACEACKEGRRRFQRPNPLRPGNMALLPEPGMPACSVPGKSGENREGTDAGYRAHFALGEEPCQPCRDAHNAKMNPDAKRRGHHRPDPEPGQPVCSVPTPLNPEGTTGTDAGYRHHRNAGEEPVTCVPCVEAHQAMIRERNPDPTGWRDSPRGRLSRKQSGQRHRAKRMGVSHLVPDWVDIDASLIGRDGPGCFYCGEEGRLWLEHVIPMQLGGPTDWWNLVMACPSQCNQSKGDLPLLVWLRRQEVLGRQMTARAWSLARGEITLATPETLVVLDIAA